jgi:hypothetical protein
MMMMRSRIWWRARTSRARSNENSVVVDVVNVDAVEERLASTHAHEHTGGVWTDRGKLSDTSHAVCYYCYYSGVELAMLTCSYLVRKSEQENSLHCIRCVALHCQ